MCAFVMRSSWAPEFSASALELQNYSSGPANMVCVFDGYIDENKEMLRHYTRYHAVWSWPIGKLTSGDLKRQDPITATQWPFKRIQLRDLQQTRTPELTESIITTGLNCNCQQVLLETVPLHRKLVSHILWPKFPSSRHDVRHRFSENLPPLPHDNGVVQLFCTVSSKELLTLSSRRTRPCF